MHIHKPSILGFGYHTYGSCGKWKAIPNGADISLSIFAINLTQDNLRVSQFLKQLFRL